jgi:hypothetical protein
VQKTVQSLGDAACLGVESTRSVSHAPTGSGREQLDEHLDVRTEGCPWQRPSARLAYGLVEGQTHWLRLNGNELPKLLLGQLAGFYRPS